MRLVRRSMIWFLPVVIIPLGALLFMQYNFLRKLEQKSVSAERNWRWRRMGRIDERTVHI